MENQQKYQIQTWLRSVTVSNMAAATLTMKQRVGNHELDTIAASQNMRHFLNVLNQKLFKNSYTRYGKKLTVIPFLESSAWDRLHYHVAIEIPNRIEFEPFCNLTKSIWRQTRFGHQEADIQHLYNHGWIDYSMKHYNFTYTLDIENMHINC